MHVLIEICSFAELELRLIDNSDKHSAFDHDLVIITYCGYGLMVMVFYLDL